MAGRRLALIAVLGGLLGVAFRVWLLASPAGALDTDEAIIGMLDVKPILHGVLPPFFPGQAYGGTQEAFLSAPIVAIFGLGVTTIRIVTLALWAVAALLVWAIGRRVLDPLRAVYAALLFWLWPAYFIWKSTRAHGFYASSLVLALLVMLLALRLREHDSRRDCLLLGLVLGCGLWASPQLVVIAVPAVAWLVWQKPHIATRAWLVIPAGVVGALPWLLANLRHDWYSFSLARNEGTWADHLRTLASSVLPEALGLRHAWSFDWLGGRVVGVTAYAALVVGFLVLLVRRRRELSLLLLPLLAFPVFYAISPYTWLTIEPRYLTLLVPVFALLLGSVMRTPVRAAAILAAAVALSVGGVNALARGQVVPFRTEGKPVPADLGPVIRTLAEHRIRYAFASKWISWRLIFETDEAVVAANVGYAHPQIRSGRVYPGDPLSGAGSVDAVPYRTVLARRNIAHVFVRGGNVEPRVRSLLRAHRYRRYVVGDFAVWLPPGS